MLFDQHIHSRFSQDGHHSILEIAQTAVSRGLQGITITDHFDLCDAEIGYQFYLDCEAARRAEFEQAREAFAGRLEIRWGLEVGHPYFMPDFAREFLASRSFDFILGSVHFLRDNSDIYLIDYSAPGAVDRVLTEYFTDLLDLLRFGGFDSLAHLDYPLRVMQGHIPAPTVKPYEALIEPILKEVIRQGLSLELNTRGYMDWKNRQEPEDWVLRRYYDLGGRRITVGSDAHVLRAVGVGIDRALAKAQSLGFPALTFYRERTPYAIPIASLLLNQDDRTAGLSIQA